MNRVLLQIGRNLIHLWEIRLDEFRFPPDRCKQILSPEERKRAGSFYFSCDRKRFVISHVALRLILSEYLSVSPESLVFLVNDFGKPELAESSLKFNLSHSGEIALVSVAENDDLGVDVEYVAPKNDYLEIAAHFFSAGEAEYIRALPEKQAHIEFFRLWTRKEAFVKACGSGLSTALQDFSVIGEGDGFGDKTFVVETKICDQSEVWYGADLSVVSNYAAAVVSRKPIAGIEFQKFNSLIKKAL